MIKPIQTTYRGYRFRSRLEARWAVFFDALGLKWEYEPEGFVLPSGKHYLPDFRVKLRRLGKSNYRSDMDYAPRDVTIWFEIKPGDQGENELFTEFMREAPLEWRGSVLNDIPDPLIVREHGAYYGSYVSWPGRNGETRTSFASSDRPFMIWGGKSVFSEDGGFCAGGGWDNNYRFCVCNSCGEVGYEFDGRSGRIGCGCAIHKNTDKNYTPDHPKIVAAFAKARAARFEYDERETYA